MRRHLVMNDWVASGYPMDEALATATSGAAEACDLADVTGLL
jgi:imidazolonepropionase-like amidohydrolase